MNVTRALATISVVALCAAGCGDPPAQSTPIEVTPVSPSPAVSSVPLPSSASVAPRSAPPRSAVPSTTAGSFAEGTQPSAGPLVFLQVIDWVGARESVHAEATFHLTENCAYLHGRPAEPVLLIWPKGQAWVDPAVPSIVHFREPVSGKLRRLTDGQRVSLLGFEIGGHGYTYEPRPHGSCPANGKDFAVQEVL